jgi:hypothetical protein
LVFYSDIYDIITKCLAPNPPKKPGHIT